MYCDDLFVVGCVDCYVEWVCYVMLCGGFFDYIDYLFECG